MATGAGSIGLGFLAGLLSVLSPCVLPLLPLVAGGALSAHRFGLVALAAGLATAFVTIGLFVATVGFSIGLGGDVFRATSAVLLGCFGAVLLSGRLQARFAAAASGVSQRGGAAMALVERFGWAGQFAVGVLLGAVWSPCVGPTLGAASLLAAQGRDLGAVAAVMAAFGIGAALPLLAVGALSREAVRRWRGGLVRAGRAGRLVMGGAALAVAGLVLTGMDHALETVMVANAPDWLADLSTRF